MYLADEIWKKIGKSESGLYYLKIKQNFFWLSNVCYYRKVWKVENKEK